MKLNKIRVKVDEVILQTPDDFAYLEDYVCYLTNLQNTLIESSTDKVYLSLSYEYNWDDEKCHTVKVLRYESDEECYLRTRTEEQKRKDMEMTKRNNELKMLEELKAKYPEH